MMSNPIVKRYYLLIEGKLASPLLAGSGLVEESVYDVIRDTEGRPYVPGSAIAGAMRHYLTDTLQDHTSIQALFGSIYKSRLLCYHMEISDYRLSYRDAVKLDEHKTVEDKAKYTMQIVEQGATFKLRLEWMIRHESIEREAIEESMICEAIDGMVRGDFTIGAKGSRGFGQLQVDQVSYVVFDHRQVEDSRRWLEWSWEHCDKKESFDRQTKWKVGETGLLEHRRAKQLSQMRKSHVLKVRLKIKQTIMIRQYAEVSIQDTTAYDYEQLKAKIGNSSYPVIPGTSWAGAIRRHLSLLLEDLKVGQAAIQQKLVTLFGTLKDRSNKNGQIIASRLQVGESLIVGGSELPTTRTAIDRFTGGTVSGALYSSKPWVHGTTELVIRWLEEQDGISNEAICGLLLWVIQDLHDGLLAVGGETAIGRGLMEVCGDVEWNGRVIEKQEEQQFRRAALEWCIAPVPTQEREEVSR